MGAVTGLFEIQGDITQEEFRAFVRRAFAGRQDVQAVQYAPLISTSQRAEFEAQLTQNGHPKGIRDPSPDGLVPPNAWNTCRSSTPIRKLATAGHMAWMCSTARPTARPSWPHVTPAKRGSAA